ncbi:DUF3710 domain-containing protein [Sciscionella sediminilitoris]|uniref:DUF3710 domain-containing protein n=1 Tax=Sciscionella sediminilitoris TaxID=1445613 RepID=UPI0004DFC2DE|nr:DUF3710 domain-containing protein [Sciscionella sp. SE31]
MGIFKRRNKGDEDYEDLEEFDDRARSGAHGGAEEYPELGPYDEEGAPEDEVPRLDLGSVRVPVPEGAQLQLEFDEEGPLRAVHLVTEIGQFTVGAFAAPRSGGLWEEIHDELATQLRKDGTAIERARGEWGQELVGRSDEVMLRFLGVDGPRWMLRGVVACPPQFADDATMLLRDIVRSTVVVRGTDPFPVRSQLPLRLPDELAAHIAEQAEG